MKPVIVRYHQKLRLYNLEEDEALSCFILNVCYDLDIAPHRVEFRTRNGEFLPETGILSDLPDYQRSRLIYVFVDDSPCIEDLQAMDMVRSRDIAPISISTSVNGERGKMTMRPKETLASFLGELVLKEHIKLDLDLYLNDKKVGNSKHSSRDRSPIRNESASEELRLRVIEDMDVKNSDVLKVVDRVANEENCKLSHSDVLIEYPAAQGQKSLSAADTVSQVVGSFLSSGRLGIKFNLYHSVPVYHTVSEDSETEETEEKICLNTMLKSNDSLMNSLNLSVGSRLILKACQINPTAVVDSECSSVKVFCRFTLPNSSGRESWSTPVKEINRFSTIQSLCNQLNQTELLKKCHDITVDGRSIRGQHNLWHEDTRSLIHDCGATDDSIVTFHTPSDRPLCVQVTRLFSADYEDHVKYLEIDTRDKGRSIRSRIAYAFKLPFAQIKWIYQSGRRLTSCSPSDLEVWRKTKMKWLSMSDDPTSDIITIKSRRLMHVIDDDKLMLMRDAEIPMIYFVDDVEYYVCSGKTEGQVEPVAANLKNPWTDMKNIAYYYGIQVKDSSNTSSVQFFVRVAGSFCDVLTGKPFRRVEIAKSQDIDIHVKNRKLSYFVVFLQQGANFPTYCIDKSLCLRIWIRDGIVLRFDNGIISRSSSSGIPQNKVFQWSRQYKGKSQFETTVSRYCHKHQMKK